MADIFISYAREDRSKVEPLAKALENAGWTIWWDRDIPVAKPWHQVIEEAIDSAKCIIVVWSKASIGSDWVLAEAEEGLRRRVLVPVFLEKVRIPLLFRSLQAADLVQCDVNASGSGYKRLLQALESILGKVSEPVDQRAAQAVQDVVYAPRGGYELVRIPGGEFLMGSPDSEEGHYSHEGPQRTVHMQGFYIGRYPVTNSEYGFYLSENTDASKPKYWGDSNNNHPRQPVIGVSWKDANQYARWARLQLPSEAQWEYACRAGTPTRYCSGDTEEDLDRVGWYYKNSGGIPQPVGEKEPNAFGLYDMHGNVGEWVEDDWHYSYKRAPRDGSAWINKFFRSSFRVIRGGNYGDPARYCRAAFRRRFEPGRCDCDLGFRLVLLPGQ